MKTCLSTRNVSQILVTIPLPPPPPEVFPNFRWTENEIVQMKASRFSYATLSWKRTLGGGGVWMEDSLSLILKDLHT